MKATLVSKIIIGLCIICLITGFFAIDKHPLYINGKEKSNKSLMSNSNKVAVLELSGTIGNAYEEAFFTKEKNASTLLKSLKAIQTDDEIKGIIVKINSPGGTVAMSQNIYNQIKKLRDKKPVITVMDDMATSGGYYIASASDRIIAQEGSLTGSIGVIFSYYDYHELLVNKLFVKPIVIKSGKFKDIGSGSRITTEEEKRMMQNMVDDSYNQFINAIIKGRIKRTDKYTAKKENLTESVLRKYADGRVFTGAQAKKLGFIDEVGDMDTAETMISKMIQEKFENKLPVKLVTYGKQSSITDLIFGITEYSSQGNIKITDFIPTSMILSRKPLYLWE